MYIIEYHLKCRYHNHNIVTITMGRSHGSLRCSNSHIVRLCKRISACAHASAAHANIPLAMYVPWSTPKPYERHAKERERKRPRPSHLLTSTKTEHQMESRLLLDVVVAQRTAILQLLTSENESLLVGWDTLLILDLRLHVVNCV